MMKKKSDHTMKEVLSLNEEQRFQVLLSQMNERCQAWHHMRDRSTQFTLWISGLAVAASWKLLQDPGGTVIQKTTVTLLVAVLGFAAIHFLRSMAKGVRANRNVLIISNIGR